MSGLERSSDSALLGSPVRAPVREFSPRRAPVTELSPNFFFWWCGGGVVGGGVVEAGTKDEATARKTTCHGFQSSQLHHS